MTEFFKRILSSKWDWDFHSWDLKVGLLLIGLYLLYQLYQRYRNDRAMRIASGLLILLVVVLYLALPGLFPDFTFAWDGLVLEYGEL